MNTSKQEFVQVTCEFPKENKMALLLKQSRVRFALGALSMCLAAVLANQAAFAAPLPAPTLEFIAADDVDGDNIWENTGTTAGRDWTMGSPQSPVTGIVDLTSSLTAAYQYPAAVGTSSTYNSFQSADASFEMWFRPDNLVGEHVLHMNGGTASAALTLDDNVLRFGARVSSSVEMSTGVTLGSLATERFSHVVGVINIGGGAGQIDLYLNGQHIGSDSVGSGFTLWTGSGPSGIGDVNGTLFAGDGFFSGTATDFDGQIAVFNFYNSALDAGQVFEAFNAFHVPPPVPEPSSFVLLGLGMLGTVMQTRRRRRRA